MDKRNRLVLIITGIIIVIALALGFTKKEFQNDTFYTIKVGESIVKNGIDNIDHFSWHELSYTYPHWLYDVVIYEIYEHFNFDGIYVSTMILYGILGLLILFVNVKFSKSFFLSLVLSVVTVIICGVYATARAQLVSYILFVLEIYFIERLLSSSKKRYGIFLFLICIILANVHAAVWPFYFILFMPYIAEELFYIIDKKFVRNKKFKVFEDKLIVEKYKGFKLLLIVMIVSLLLGFLTPIGSTPYLYFIKIMMGNSQKYIMEHAALTLAYNPFVIAYLLVYLFILIFTKIRVRVSDFFMIFGLIVMSFMSVRHVSFLISFGMIILTRIIVELFSIKNRDKVFELNIPWYGSLIIMIVVILCSKFIYDNTCNKPFINSNLYPVTATQFLKKKYNIDKIKLYNDYDFGSYLLFEGIPVYIDSRSDLYTKPFNNKFDIFDEAMNIQYNYGEVFNKYGVTHILIYSDTELARILDVSSNYDSVYSDGVFKVYEVLSNKSDEYNIS